MDRVDEEIIRLLKTDSRMSFVKLGRSVGLSEGAVRRRTQNLIKERIIKRFSLELGATEGASAITLLSASPSVPTPEVSERLKSIKGVEVVYEITGQYDIAAILRAANIAEINRSIDEVRKIAGVSDTNTIIILREIR